MNKLKNDCVKNATSVTNLSMEESDFDSAPEVVESCEAQAQKAFGGVFTILRKLCSRVGELGG